MNILVQKLQRVKQNKTLPQKKRNSIERIRAIYFLRGSFSNNEKTIHFYITSYLNDQMRHDELSLTLKLTKQFFLQSTLPWSSDSISEAKLKLLPQIKKPDLTKSRKLHFYDRRHYYIIVSSGRSMIHSMTRVGPIIDPWGAPPITGHSWDFPCRTTKKHLLLRNKKIKTENQKGYSQYLNLWWGPAC